MPLTSLADDFKQTLFTFPSTEILLNPYSYSHPESDRPDAPLTRQANLLSYLSHFQRKPQILIVGEAPGPWGCRFSGVPFTSERQLAEKALPFSGLPTSNQNPPAAERSATIFWEALKPYHDRFFVWNSLPLLPHRLNEPDQLRPPTTNELRDFRLILETTIDHLNPQRILAVGRRAEYALRLLGQPCRYLRHPSHGGKQAFLQILNEFD